MGWVEHKRTVNHTNARTTYRAHEGNAGKGKSGRGANQSNDVAVIFKIIGKHGGDHLGFIAETGRKQRTNGAVNQAGNQRFLFCRPAFALEIAAGNLARRIGLFLVVHSERKEINSRLFRTRRNGSSENCCLTVGYNNSTIRLPRHAAGFNAQGLSRPFQFFNINFKHNLFLIALRRRLRSPTWTASPLSVQSLALLPEGEFGDAGGNSVIRPLIQLSAAELAADFETLDQGLITALILRLQIVEKAAAQAHHLEQTAA